jgi:hypothetical protein
MTAPDHPLPSQGGSYLRAADGSLIPAPMAEDEVPPKSTKGAKTAPKEA